MLDIIPATKIPLPRSQVLTYFYSEKLPEGALVEIELGKRKVHGLVIACRSLKSTKASIKKSAYGLKKLKKVIVPKAVIGNQGIELMRWASQYYWEPLGLFLKKLLPSGRKIPDSAAASADTQSRTDRCGQKIKLIQRLAKPQTLAKYIIDSKTKGQVLVLINRQVLAGELVNHLQNKGVRAVQITSQDSLRNAREKWLGVREGKLKVIIGVRSVVFAPFKELEKIIIVGEDKFAYKSWDQHPRFHAQFLAYKLSDIWKADIDIFTLIPSLNLYHAIGKRADVNLRMAKFRSEVEILDLTKERQAGNFGPLGENSRKELEKILGRGGRALMMHNRRGYDLVRQCDYCGYAARCDNCDISLVYYGPPLKSLLCHWCGLRKKLPALCPQCGSSHLRGRGLGLEKLKHFLEKNFPDRGIFLPKMERGSAFSEYQTVLQSFLTMPGSIFLSTAAFIDPRLEGKIDLALVVNANTLLDVASYTAYEEALNVLATLAVISPRLIIQGFALKDNPVILTLRGEKKIDEFYKKEISMRKMLELPPFTQHTLIYCKAVQITELSAQLKKAFAPFNSNGLKLEGPFPVKEKGARAQGFLLSAQRERLGLRNRFLKRLPRGWQVDVDPIMI